MFYYNKVILAGAIGRDPEMKTSKNGINYATVSLATSKRKKTSGAFNTQNWTEETTWHNLKIYDNKDFKKASNFCKSVSKGDNIQIEGSLSIREYDNNGQPVKFSEIIVDNYFIVQNKKKYDLLDQLDSPPSKSPKLEIIDDEIPF